jgi:branched-chain amino acid transport system permease protein
MITFGIGELVWATALMFPAYFGGESGIAGNRVVGLAPWGLTFGSQIQLYYLIATYTLVCTTMMFAFTLTPLGRMLNAVRDNPERVAFVGYNPQRVRWLALVISAFFAGISGGLAALHFEMVSSEVFSAYRSGAYLLFTFVGGSTLFFGPVLGGVLMVLAFVLLPGLTPAWLLYLGFVFVGMVIYAPSGLAGLLLAGWRVVLRVADRRWLGRVWGPLVMFIMFGWFAVGGVVTLIEMIYLLQYSDTASRHLNWMGLQLDVHAGKSWWGSVLASGLGWSGFEWSRRHLLQRWDHLERGAL